MSCHSPVGSSYSLRFVNDGACLFFEFDEVKDWDISLLTLIQDFDSMNRNTYKKLIFFFFLASEMEQLRISPATMLEDEITWLDNFEPNRTAECETSEADNILLAGHLRLIKTLLSLCGTEKEMLGNYCFILSCDRIPHFQFLP